MANRSSAGTTSSLDAWTACSIVMSYYGSLCPTPPTCWDYLAAAVLLVPALVLPYRRWTTSVKMEPGVSVFTKEFREGFMGMMRKERTDDE